MPIHLPAPATEAPRDGKGWNRLSLGAHYGAPSGQCAIRPRTYAALVASFNTRLAAWGSCAPCGRDGACDGCPVFGRLTQPTCMDALGDRVLVRLWTGHGHDRDGGQPHVMNRPEQGWESTSRPWSWEELARLTGWVPDGEHHDEHSDGFWLRCTDPKGETR